MCCMHKLASPRLFIPRCIWLIVSWHWHNVIHVFIFFNCSFLCRVMEVGRQRAEHEEIVQRILMYCVHDKHLVFFLMFSWAHQLPLSIFIFCVSLSFQMLLNECGSLFSFLLWPFLVFLNMNYYHWDTCLSEITWRFIYSWETEPHNIICFTVETCRFFSRLCKCCYKYLPWKRTRFYSFIFVWLGSRICMVVIQYGLCGRRRAATSTVGEESISLPLPACRDRFVVNNIWAESQSSMLFHLPRDRQPYTLQRCR